jgi:hypothetical protein
MNIPKPKQYKDLLIENHIRNLIKTYVVMNGPSDITYFDSLTLMINVHRTGLISLDHRKFILPIITKFNLSDSMIIHTTVRKILYETTE